MTYLLLMYRIVVPQAVIRVLPGILNQFVTCFKSSSIVSIIAVPDIMYHATLIVSQTFLPMPVYTIVALIYFLMVMGISWLMRLATRGLPNFGYFHAAPRTRRQPDERNECENPYRIRGVHKRFNKLEVLRGIDIDIDSGQAVAMLGPSGSGKSTLVRCINHLEPIQGGEIEVGATRITAKGLEVRGPAAQQPRGGQVPYQCRDGVSSHSTCFRI